MRRIRALPEWLESHAAQRLDEALAVRAQRAIHLDDALDSRGDLTLGNRRADDFPERREAVRRAAERDLVPLLAVLVDAEDADVADVVMAAGVHAAGHLDLDIAEVVEVVEIVEALLDLPGDAQGAGVRERAEVQPGTGDHVGERADV